MNDFYEPSAALVDALDQLGSLEQQLAAQAAVKVAADAEVAGAIARRDAATSELAALEVKISEARRQLGI